METQALGNEPSEEPQLVAKLPSGFAREHDVASDSVRILVRVDVPEPEPGDDSEPPPTLPSTAPPPPPPPDRV